MAELNTATPATVSASIVDALSAAIVTRPAVTAAPSRNAAVVPANSFMATEAPKPAPMAVWLIVTAIAAAPPSAVIRVRSVAVRATAPAAATDPPRTNARVEPVIEFSETEAATSTVMPIELVEVAGVGDGPAAATVTARTDPPRAASRRTAPAPATVVPSRDASVVASSVFLLNEPASATASMLLAARLSEPVTATTCVSLRLSRARSPPARSRAAFATPTRVTSRTSLIPTAPATPIDAGSFVGVAPEANLAAVRSATAPATDTPRMRPVLRADSVSPDTPSVATGAPRAASPTSAAVSRLTRLTAPLAPTPTAPATITAPATLV